MLTRADVRALRLRAQGLAGERDGAAVDRGAPGVVDRLFAMQGQDLPGVLWSLGLRSVDDDRDAVRAAFDAGLLVRSWPFRGTLHVIAAVDLPWVLAITAPRMLAARVRRRRELEIDDAVLERARAVSVRATADGARVARAGLMAEFDEAGIDTTGQRGYHLISHLATEGVIAFGPFDGAEQLIVNLADWVSRPRALDPDEGTREIVRRYLRGRGPSTVADLAWWSGLPVRAVRSAAADLGDDVAVVDADGVEQLVWTSLLDGGTAAGRPVLALPGFDELLLGYADRSATLARDHAASIVPGGNGVFRRTLVQRGQVVGTWRAVEAAAGVRVVAETFGDVPRGVERGLAREASRYARFLGAPLLEVVLAPRSA